MEPSGLQDRSSGVPRLLEAVLEALGRGVIVLDAQGQVAYANRAGWAAIQSLGDRAVSGVELAGVLSKMGGRTVALGHGSEVLGHVVIFAEAGEVTLAQRERAAILETLEGTGWRLREAARRLGISRTTLWRRLKEYGVRRSGR